MLPIADELKHTYEGLVSLGESNQGIELFDGELIVTPTPTTKHQLIVTSIAMELHVYVQQWLVFFRMKCLKS